MFYSVDYCGATIHAANDGHGERVIYQLADRRLHAARSVHAAKCRITRALNRLVALRVKRASLEMTRETMARANHAIDTSPTHATAKATLITLDFNPEYADSLIVCDGFSLQAIGATASRIDDIDKQITAIAGD